MSSPHDALLNRLTGLLEAEPELAESFAAFVGTAQNPDLESLLEEIDSSDYSVLDWADALVSFDRWLEAKGATERPFAAMVGYVHCCTLMNAPQISLPSLKVIVGQSLTEFGFEAIS